MFDYLKPSQKRILDKGFWVICKKTTGAALNAIPDHQATRLELRHLTGEQVVFTRLAMQRAD